MSHRMATARLLDNAVHDHAVFNGDRFIDRVQHCFI